MKFAILYFTKDVGPTDMERIRAKILAGNPLILKATHSGVPGDGLIVSFKNMGDLAGINSIAGNGVSEIKLL